MKINRLLTPHNHNEGTIDRIKYIVIHYVGALGGAKANCQWYAGGNRNASAHYFVDFDGAVWQSVEDKDVAWHCGGKKYADTSGGTYHGICTNANSIGIEMCVRNKGSQADTSRDWYFEDSTVKAAIQLTRELMAKYNIPADRVIRHYDVTGKICPNPYVYNAGEHTWDAFKAAIALKEKKAGWQQEDGGWRCYYLDGSGSYPVNAWYQDGGKWYWFDGAGKMVYDTWYRYNGGWYYLGHDGVMVKGLQAVDGKWYYLDESGRMATNPVTLTPDQDGALRYPGLAD